MSKNEIVKEIIDWVRVIVISVLIGLFINNTLIVNAEVPSGSMENTIMTKDKIITSRLSYLFSEPERFDIVVFKFPDNEKLLYVKRIIGLPGETLDIIDGKIYVNNSNVPLEDNFVDSDSEDYYSNGHYEIPDNNYFMMGDNRINSVDSKDWNNTFVNEKKILGKPIFRYYPNFTIFKDK